jgi:hypothetical protein
MPFLICAVPVCPIRSEAAHKSEQVSQLLFGELCELLETAKDFVRIKCQYDGYEGWCQWNQLEEVQDLFTNTENYKLAGGWINELKMNNEVMHIPYGSSLNFLHGNSGIIGKSAIVYEGIIAQTGKEIRQDEMIKKVAYTFLNTPYLWGGRSVFGIDCSGFTQLVCKFLQLPLLRDAHQQAMQGEAIGFLQEAKCGDLAFFDNDAGRITHVGILLDGDTIIHSSGKVRVDKIDNLGIVNAETGKRTHQLRVIKRVLPEQ